MNEETHTIQQIADYALLRRLLQSFLLIPSVHHVTDTRRTQTVAVGLSV